MGRFPIALALLGTILVGGAALAQQGLIIEPWRRSVATPSRPALPGLPESGLPPVAAPQPPAPLAKPAAPKQPAPDRWSPPVVELLVDPWAKDRLAPPARSRWVPETVEIIDPWAEPAPEPPRIASGPVAAPHAAIF